MSDDGGDPVDEKVSSSLPALTDDTEIIDKVLVRSDMVNLLADMVSRSASRVRAEIASDLNCIWLCRASQDRDEETADQLVHYVPVPLQTGLPPSGSGTAAVVDSIHKVESSEKKKWGQRLQQIADRAGLAAKINDRGR